MVTAVDITKLPVSSFAKEIDEKNSSMVAMHDKLVKSTLYWHKIIVKDCATSDRDVILKAVAGACDPHEFVPVLFKFDNKGNAHFLCKNAGKAISKLCEKGLIVENPLDKSKPFKLKVVLAFQRTSEIIVSWEEQLLANFYKRYNYTTKQCNLDSFYKEGEVSWYFVSQLSILATLVKHCKQKNLQISHLKLSNNSIKYMSSVLGTFTSSLMVLDLRNNLIEKLSDLQFLKNMNVVELYLEGNPLCEEFDEISYVQNVREICPKIEKLDGIFLGQKGFLAFRRNCLCSSDGQDLVDQFLEHFFTIYDSNNRALLESLYHRDALFSMTANYLSGHHSTPTAQLKAYSVISRNLKTIADLSRNDIFLFRGSSSIVKIIKNLPPVEHDPYTFTVDLIHYTESLAIIVVTGTFRESSENLLTAERFLGFTRNFVLKISQLGEVSILNDQLHVHNATTAQQMRAFKIARIPQVNNITIPPAQTQKEQNEMAETLKAITNLNLDWAKKCLEECQYDLKKSLALFMDLCQSNKIPLDAYK